MCMFDSVVANQGQPQYELHILFYSVSANRGQLLYTFSRGAEGAGGAVSQEGRAQTPYNPVPQYKHLQHLRRPRRMAGGRSAGRNKKAEKNENIFLPCSQIHVPCYPGRLPAIRFRSPPPRRVNCLVGHVVVLSTFGVFRVLTSKVLSFFYVLDVFPGCIASLPSRIFDSFAIVVRETGFHEFCPYFCIYGSLEWLDPVGNWFTFYQSAVKKWPVIFKPTAQKPMVCRRRHFFKTLH